MNPRIKKEPKHKKAFELHVKYEHGDADLTTKETFSFTNEEDFINACKFFYECLNFIPNSGYEKLGYYQSIPAEANNGRSTEKKVLERVINIGKKYGIEDGIVEEYIQRDNHYHNGYADLEGIKSTINGQNKVLVFKEGLETNRISLPNIGDVMTVNPDHINGCGKDIFGGDYIDYMPNSGVKDFLVKNFEAKVLDCGIQFYHDYDNKYYHDYTHFHYVLLLEVSNNVLKSNIKHYKDKTPLKLCIGMYGWDPEFETKFKKEKYDDLNYYEIG